MLKKILSFIFVFAFSLFFVAIIFPYIFFHQEKNFQAIFLDVGQGDATLLQTPLGKNILIDGGPDMTLLYKLGQYLPWWKQDIDLIVISHPHADHIIGIIEVIKRFKVHAVVMTDAAINTPEFGELRDVLKENKVTIDILTSRKSLDIEDNVHFEFFHPEKSTENIKEKDINNTSILLRVSYKKSSILFTGDLEERGQKENLNENIDSDILKVPHQGSIDSLSEEFIKKVSPFYSIIFVGKNNYGHPSQRVVEEHQRQGSKILITQKIGDIRFASNGKKFFLK